VDGTVACGEPFARRPNPPYCRDMPELHVEPQVLAEAGRSLATQRSVPADAVVALARGLEIIAAALPGSSTADAAGHLGAVLAAELRASAVELAALGAALTTAAEEYAAVEREITTGIERAGRRAA
jgi:hypothetical protein